jgi:hypothetical protein
VEPPLGGTFPAAPEGNLQVFLPTIAAQRQTDVKEDLAIVVRRRIEIPEQVGIRRNAKLAFTQHAKAAQHRDGIWVQMDQLTPNIVQNRNKELTRRKAKPTHHMRLKANDVRSIDHQKIQSCGGAEQYPWEPTSGMIGRDILICHYRCFPILV